MMAAIGKAVNAETGPPKPGPPKPHHRGTVSEDPLKKKKYKFSPRHSSNVQRLSQLPWNRCGRTAHGFWHDASSSPATPTILPDVPLVLFSLGAGGKVGCYLSKRRLVTVFVLQLAAQ
ncbi:hypothetical protein BaRGS_00036838 [Batillaria attramentaria]|uniref:Uncharacterized protein n=1 Tax=Batillaria attramentaria TaxID=370345 RepID=A0ABD0JBP0_9CAEN